MITNILVWGSVIGLVHFMIIGILYGNPLVDRIYKEAQRTEPGVRKWPSMPAYMIRQFLGTQVEISSSPGPTFGCAGWSPFRGMRLLWCLGRCSRRYACTPGFGICGSNPHTLTDC